MLAQDQPLISVIMPFYSKSYFDLDTTISSILNQDYNKIEVVIVDDCSPISAKDCITKYKGDSRVIIIRNDFNRRGGVSRNIGIEHANGEFVSFIDHDDAWYSNKLSEQYSLFDTLKNNHPDQNIVIYSKCRVIDGDCSYIYPKNAKRTEESVSEYLFCSLGLIQTSGIFLKRELAICAGFEDIKRHQDYQFCFSLEKEGAAFYMCDKPLYDFIQIPKLNDYNFSIDWLDDHKESFSEQSEQGFKKNVVIRSMISNKHWLKAFKYASFNNLARSFFWQFSLYFLKKNLPKRLISIVQVKIRKRK